jgi:hypothetical protein
MSIPTMENFKSGDYVKFIGCDEDNEASKIFFVGDKYYVEKLQHNKLTLRGIYGKFNASMFEKV